MSEYIPQWQKEAEEEKLDETYTDIPQVQQRSFDENMYPRYENDTYKKEKARNDVPYDYTAPIHAFGSNEKMRDNSNFNTEEENTNTYDNGNSLVQEAYSLSADDIINE